LRYVPDITFVYDPTLESGSHMEKLFDKIRKEGVENGTPI
jgi:ribosome-binding factor A